MVISAHLLDLGAQQVLEAAVVGELGQLIGDRLATHLEWSSTFSKASVACAASERSSSRSSSLNGRPLRATVISPCARPPDSIGASATDATLVCPDPASPTPPAVSATRSAVRTFASSPLSEPTRIVSARGS
jgi:hypothetical protein